LDVKDKVIVVTGGASGIGTALAKKFISAGAKAVAIADMDAEGAKQVSAEIGDKATAFTLDVTDEAAVQKMVDDFEAANGPIDLYCSNAGIIYTDAPDWTVISQTNEQWQKVWEVNVFSHILACRAVLPRMIERGKGGFLITASAAGLLSQIGTSSYATTKHAAVGFAESLAITHGDDGIYVGCVCPQAVRSKMTLGAEKSSAAVDGILEADEFAERVLTQMGEGRFMIRPHDTVEGYFQNKANNYDRWIGGMKKMRRHQMAENDSAI